MLRKVYLQARLKHTCVEVLIAFPRLVDTLGVAGAFSDVLCRGWCGFYCMGCHTPFPVDGLTHLHTYLTHHHLHHQGDSLSARSFGAKNTAIGQKQNGNAFAWRKDPTSPEQVLPMDVVVRSIDCSIAVTLPHQRQSGYGVFFPSTTQRCIVCRLWQLVGTHKRVPRRATRRPT